MSAANTTRQYFYSVGKRKSAIARVKLYADGKGGVEVNGKKTGDYFSGVQVENAVAPLALVGKKNEFDVDVQVFGGGKSAQSDAMRHGVSRALLLFDPQLRSQLKHEGFLRRDARIKERKKPGLRRARRAPQFSKR
ncbi:30S ribosomal protein S9 [Candidatus Peregrinibacteria bacterium CG10_big_fil_rev_8_21_14_0_10_49_10]|nr:MAG: 30S ribosomal protein S9 [Candidatus Peregrinibacteria bacterium CG10_big_fil_rev_8_21_14_0_10_49_10]